MSKLIDLESIATDHLRHLTVDIQNRSVGTQGNLAATEYFKDCSAALDMSTEQQWFDCLNWIQNGAALSVNGEQFEVRPSPYTLGCRLQAPLEQIMTLDELRSAQIENRIAVLIGEIAKEQIMPKNFPFYNPEEHQQIIDLLEKKQPLALVAATTESPETAGALYPFPLFEDGDFNIPSVYTTEAVGRRLLDCCGRPADLEIHAKRSPARGCNVLASRKGRSSKKVVVCAHIDSKLGTPGALDNAAGTVVLLLLARLLGEHAGNIGVELVAINGEDHYSAAGEIVYLSSILAHKEDILLAVNIDAVGLQQGKTAVSTYDCPKSIKAFISEIVAANTGLINGEPWYQGDHSIFLQNGIPACAFTSEQLNHILTRIAHTAEDTLDLIDVKQLVGSAKAILAIILQVDQVF